MLGEVRWSLWPDGQPVTQQDHPVYLGIPIPLPSFSRAQFYEPIVQDCCYILRNLITAKSFLSIKQRRYAVSAVVMKKLCYSSMIARLTTKQSDKIRSLVMQAIFDKPLACHDAAVALVLQGHLLDYNLLPFMLPSPTGTGIFPMLDLEFCCNICKLSLAMLVKVLFVSFGMIFILSLGALMRIKLSFLMIVM